MWFISRNIQSHQTNTYDKKVVIQFQAFSLDSIYYKMQSKSFTSCRNVYIYQEALLVV